MALASGWCTRSSPCGTATSTTPTRRWNLTLTAADKPDFRDFAYLALTIGHDVQVSDTDLQAEADSRLAPIRHALLSYAFGAIIVAITINVVASLLNK